MSRQRNRNVIVSLALVFVIALSACAPKATPTSVPPTPKPQTGPTAVPPTAVPPTAEPMPTEIKVGYLLPLSGSQAPLGMEVKAAVETALEIVNGVYDMNLPLAKEAGLPNFNGAKIKLVFADTQAVPEKCMSEAERLITEEKVVMLAGGYSSGCAGPASQVAERFGIPWLSDISSSPTLHQRGLKWFVRVGPHDAEGAKFTFDFFMDLQTTKGVAINSLATIHENTLYGADASNEANNWAREKGLKVVANIPYPFETADMTAEIGTLKAANPDIVIAATYIADGILMTKTMKDQNFNPKMYLSQSAVQLMSGYLEPLGKLAEYQCAMDAFAVDEGKARPLVKQVNDLYKSRTGTDLTGENAIPAMGVIVFSDAINRAKSLQPDVIMKALKETNIPEDQCFIATAGVAFDPENGQNIHGGKLVLQIRDGVPRVVWPFNRATVDLVYPMPTWSER
jgi:branched-chain amino acid transport system substrate-binding protein